jgi:alpha,alpha-trehalose phosphorylase
VETEFLPEKNAQSQSIFSLANEYMGTRGLFEEGGAQLGVNSYEGCYINGIYVREKYQYIWKRQAMPDEANFIANTTNWLSLSITVGTETFSMGESEYSGYRRVLDMRNGTLSRELFFTTKSGENTHLSFERFISYDNMHCSAIRLKIKALNHSTPIKITLSLDGRKGNAVYVLHEKAGQALVSEADTGTMSLLKKLPSTGQYFITRCQITASFENKELPINVDPLNPGIALSFIPAQGKEYSIDKLVATVTSRDCGYPHGLIPKGAAHLAVDSEIEKEIVSFLQDKSMGILNEMQKQGYERLHARHVEAVGRMWQHSDVEIEGDPLSQQGIRYCMFQLNNTYRGFDPKLNIAAKGLTGEYYQGRHFWDTESYCLPYYLFTNPKAARNLVASRFHHLPEARALARIFKYKGAMYPWQTIDGSEECPIWEYTFGEIHINAIVPYAIYLYVRTTGDREYLYHQGIEVVLETSRFWASRADFIPYRNGYAINRVTGPDEYQQMVNNNYYTNYMAKSTLQYAVDTIEEMKIKAPEAWRAVCEKIGFDETETCQWRKIIDGMILNFDDKLSIFVEDDMFLSLSPVAREDLDKDRDIPVESKWSIEKFQKAQIVKQPDVLLMFFLHPDRFSLEEKKNNYRFYEQRTVHGSSLSPCIHSILANEIGRPHQAYEYFLWSSRLDLDDFNGNVEQGLHISAMSGTWLNIVFGFGGMRIKDDSLEFFPTLPTAWTAYRFKINYRESALQFEVGRGWVSARVQQGGNVFIEIYGKRVELSNSEFRIEMPPEILFPPVLEAVIFDLDGVITDTAKYHYLAWKTIADEEGIYFDEHINERLKGVSRMESLEIILERASRQYAQKDKEILAAIKNQRYVEMLDRLNQADILPGIPRLLSEIKKAGIKTAICSASRNTGKILQKLSINDCFDAVVTGNDTTFSKPHPEGLLLAAERLGIKPENCIVIEDAFAGVEAARAANMKSIGIGDKLQLHNADYVLRCTEHLSLERLMMVF